MRRPALGLLMGLLMVGPLGGWGRVGAETITVFCGAATKPAMEEAARAFERETGTKVYLNFGGSGTVLSQMKLSKTGDLFIPGTPDYMEKAKQRGRPRPWEDGEDTRLSDPGHLGAAWEPQRYRVPR